MRFIKQTFLLVIVSTLLVSCGGPFTRVTKPEYANEKQGYNVNLPTGWVQYKSPQTGDALIISRDGYSLQSIQINGLTHEKAFEKIKKISNGLMPVSDLADLEIAEFKAVNPNAASVKILENELAKVSNKNAFKLHLEYLNDKGLRLEHKVYGFATKEYYYRLSYFAPTLHYYKRDEHVFDKVVSEFRLNSE